MSKPLSEPEIRDILSQTLHGPLPQKTVDRMMATLSQVLILRKALDKQKEQLIEYEAKLDHKEAQLDSVRGALTMLQAVIGPRSKME